MRNGKATTRCGCATLWRPRRLLLFRPCGRGVEICRPGVSLGSGGSPGASLVRRRMGKRSVSPVGDGLSPAGWSMRRRPRASGRIAAPIRCAGAVPGFPGTAPLLLEAVASGGRCFGRAVPDAGSVPGGAQGMRARPSAAAPDAGLPDPDRAAAVPGDLRGGRATIPARGDAGASNAGAQRCGCGCAAAAALGGAVDRRRRRAVAPALGGAGGAGARRCLRQGRNLRNRACRARGSGRSPAAAPTPPLASGAVAVLEPARDAGRGRRRSPAHDRTADQH